MKARRETKKAPAKMNFFLKKDNYHKCIKKLPEYQKESEQLRTAL